MSLNKNRTEQFYDARDWSCIKIWREFWHDKLLENIDIDDNMLIPSIPDYRKEEVCKWLTNRAKSRNTRYRYCMFTINFKEDVSLEYIMKKLKKCLIKSWIEKWLYCYEWRDIDKGMHVHLKCWITDKQNVYNCKKEIYNTFKDCVGNKLHVNVRYSNREDCFDDYIKGLKNGEVKDTHLIDIDMRNKLKLDNWYSGENERSGT